MVQLASQTSSPLLTSTSIETYLRSQGHPDARIVEMRPLGASTQEELKDYGYGQPLYVRFQSASREEERVIRTMSPDPFGHDRRADRANVLVLAFDTFNAIPKHIRAFDVGSFAENGAMVSMARGEFFLVSNYVEGALYAHDLSALICAEHAPEVDLERGRALALYLAELHRENRDESAYIRALRDAIGSGEGAFGLCDSYPVEHRVATPERLEGIEHGLVRWRWRLRHLAGRCRRTHGDFHPFNILFRDGTDLSVLDASRGGAGEPADDLTALSINYLFFALTRRDTFSGALREVWDAFWWSYLNATQDHQVLSVVAPFFAWRALVLASPVWYPNISEVLRDRLLVFAERLLSEDITFDPFRIGDLA